MTDKNDSISHLQSKLDNLLKRQDSFAKEIRELQEEIYWLKSASEADQSEEFNAIKPEQLPIEIEPEEIKETDLSFGPAAPKELFDEQKIFRKPDFGFREGTKSNLEKFIGENLINRIGITITIIGVAIGTKYSIDHQLISPLTRIILGYLMGLVLLGFGIKLKNNYKNYSSVLVSGAIAILYFITYFAYSFYALIPQVTTFILMVIFTAFAVYAAINYNKQVIAHIGLVGAYAVPFLLSDGSGNVKVLFSYISIINIGILVIAFTKYWKPLYFSSFVITWFVFYFWYMTSYDSVHFVLSLIFLFVFFVTFYVILLVYKLIRFEKYNVGDIVLLLSNSFIFFGIGYAILDGHEKGEHLLGLFTLGNAMIHLIAGLIIYIQKLADRNLFYLVTGLVLVFITIAIPVQFDGNWVTLLWAFEAALLFWIGRTKVAPVYEYLSYPLMFLAFFSMAHDWQTLYIIADIPGDRLVPIININFLTSLLFIGAFVFINYHNQHKKAAPTPLYLEGIGTFMTFSIPAILIFTLYNAFRVEIASYWDQLYQDSYLAIKKEGTAIVDFYWNYDLSRFKTLWILNYSMLFVSILSYINIKKIRNLNLAFISLGLTVIIIIVFLTSGLYTLSELRETYLNQTLAEYYPRYNFNIIIRYISFVFTSLLMISAYICLKNNFLKTARAQLTIPFDFVLFTTIVWVASSELISWMDIMEFSGSYKLGLSILWGVYALLLIILGIWKNKKHIRIGAIGLFAVTLLKLFFYDISHLGTISKTIVFVTLGILLLIISFLYNKYKHLIFDEERS